MANLSGKMDNGYKWILRRSSKKEICPRCGQRRFVPYVASADGKTLAGAEYGRCDREQNCGYHLYPNGKEVGDIEPVVKPERRPLRFYRAAVQIDTSTNLFDYVAALMGVSHAMAIWQRYAIGRDGERTVFWQIAKDGTVRTGKSIPYGRDGHRVKIDEFPANWLHKSKKWREWCTGEELQQCFFGEHLLNEEPTAPVAIVESEKTAAILSEYSSKYIWLASGGAQGIKSEEKNAALKGREVLLIPDNGQYWNWKAVADKYGWECTDAIEKSPCFEGCDILDLVERGWLGEELLINRKEL